MAKAKARLEDLDYSGITHLAQAWELATGIKGITRSTVLKPSLHKTANRICHFRNGIM